MFIRKNGGWFSQIAAPLKAGPVRIPFAGLASTKGDDGAAECAQDSGAECGQALLRKVVEKRKPAVHTPDAQPQLLGILRPKIFDESIESLIAGDDFSDLFFASRLQAMWSDLQALARSRADLRRLPGSLPLERCDALDSFKVMIHG